MGSNSSVQGGVRVKDKPKFVSIEEDWESLKISI